MGSITMDTPRDASGRRPKREVPEAVLVDIVARRIMGESLRGIEKATGVPRSTVSELLRKPDVVALVKAEQDKIAATESAQADVLRDAKKREKKQATGAARRRKAKDPQAQAAAAEASAKADGGKKSLGFVRFGWDNDGNFISAFSTPGGSLEHESEDEWLIRKAEERELPPPPRPITVRYTGRNGPGQFGLDIYDEPDVQHRARLLAREIGGDAEEHADALRAVRPGAEVEFRYEPEFEG